MVTGPVLHLLTLLLLLGNIEFGCDPFEAVLRTGNHIRRNENCKRR
jgi:hypothetical protein